MGTIAFASYCDIISYNVNYSKYKINRFWKLELLIFLCGLFWEYIAPMFRHDTVSDIFDIAAYLFGGVIFWIIKKLAVDGISHNNANDREEAV